MADSDARVIYVGTGSDGSPIYEVCFEHAVKLRRVTLATHDPTYALGMAFLDPDPTIEERVADVKKLTEGASGEGVDG